MERELKKHNPIYQQFTDNLYVPQSRREEFIYFAKFFSNVPLHMEMTIPNVLQRRL